MHHASIAHGPVHATAGSMQEVAITLVRLYQQYRIKLQPGQIPLKVKQTFALAPAAGLYVSVNSRGQIG